MRRPSRCNSGTATPAATPAPALSGLPPAPPPGTTRVARAAAPALVQVGAIVQGGPVFLPCRVAVSREERRRAELAVLVDSVEREAEPRLALLVQQPRLGHRDHALQGFEARVGRLHAPAHALPGEECPTYLDVRFPAAGGAGRSHVVVGVLARPDQRRVAHAARNFPCQAAG